MVENKGLLEEIVRKAKSFSPGQWRRTKAPHYSGEAFVISNQGYKYVLEKWSGSGCDPDMGGCSFYCDHSCYELTVLKGKEEIVSIDYLDRVKGGSIVQVYKSIIKYVDSEEQKAEKKEEERSHQLEEELLSDLKK